MKKRTDKKHPVAGRMLFTFYLLNLKGRRVDYFFGQSTYEKENYKNNVGCIIFTILSISVNYDGFMFNL